MLFNGRITDIFGFCVWHPVKARMVSISPDCSPDSLRVLIFRRFAGHYLRQTGFWLLYESAEVVPGLKLLNLLAFSLFVDTAKPYGCPPVHFWVVCKVCG